jgi:hypothetical protein
MSRSGYCEDMDDQWALIRWRGAVDSARRGRRGQAFFRDLVAALDALPEKKLIADSLQEPTGAVCALGALGKAREIDMAPLDPEDPETVAGVFNIASALSREVVWVNDEMGRHDETPEQRFERVRRWAVRQIAKTEQVSA